MQRFPSLCLVSVIELVVSDLRPFEAATDRRRNPAHARGLAVDGHASDLRMP